MIAPAHPAPESPGILNGPNSEAALNATGGSEVYSPAPSTGDNADRQLNVSDALSYLDTVQTQFADQPDVFNQFLYIIKDFKNQAIDALGVIYRVSVLFQGNGPLIAGFNTFLPPGYRMDISPDKPGVVKVTSPSGTVILPAA